MNHFSTFGIFWFLLYAHCTPTQDQAIAVSEVSFEDGETYESTNLIKSSGMYKIEGSEHEFGITGIDTMLGNEVVLHTDDNSPVQMELVNLEDTQQLFTMTTRSKLGIRQYSYELSAVYKYQEGRILGKSLFSGFNYSTSGQPQDRFVIHSGEALPAELQPHVLWTEEDFNYSAFGNSIILTLRAEPETYRYYLMNFVNSSEQVKWMHTNGRSYTRRVPLYPMKVYNYFKDFIAGPPPANNP